MFSRSEADRATLNAVLEAAQAGDHTGAARLARAALDGGFEHPLLLNVAALALERDGQLADAESLLHRAVVMDPDDRAARNALGLCLLRLERPAEALQHFDALIGLDPDLAFAHVSRGNSLRALGAVRDAETSYQRALDLDPNHGLAWAGLAQIAADRGAYHDARKWAGEALERMPGLPDAVMSLASAELGDGQPLAAEGRIRALLEDQRLTPLERAYAQGLLGDILDALDRPAEAIAAYRQCNQALQRLYAERFAGSKALEHVRGMTRYFQSVPPGPWQTVVRAPLKHGGAAGLVFLLGFPRSGTTLLEVILEGHPNIVTLEEKESLIDGVREFLRGPEDLARLAAAHPAELDALRDSYWRLVGAAGVDVAGKLFIDKHPLNTLKLPLIAKLFPDAKILLACRDPRDIVLSCFRHRFQMSAPIYELLTLEGAARYYDAVMQFLIRMTTLLPLETCLVRHEDVVTEFAREMKRICAFLGIDWAPGMKDFAARTHDRATLTPSTAQLVRGLSTEGLGQWRRYRNHLFAVLPTLEPWVNRFYYDP